MMARDVYIINEVRTTSFKDYLWIKASCMAYFFLQIAHSERVVSW